MPSGPRVALGGSPVPWILYGTAWKEDRTEALTLLALQQGFRGIDTACQRKHYFEEGVGQGIARWIESGAGKRDDLFLQTKFTFQNGQDQRLPYDPKAPIGLQVEQSFQKSLTHLGTNRIDSLVLHGPNQRSGLGKADWEAYRSMEQIHDAGLVNFLGISNVDLDQLEALCRGARVKPTFVQNRCYAELKWDLEVRAFCKKEKILYQGFSLLTANRAHLSHPLVMQIARAHKRTVPQIAFCFAYQVGMLPLTGTTSASHMAEDLQSRDFSLSAEEIATIEGTL